MNRRQFLKRGAMVGAAVAVAPVAVLAAEELATGSIVTGLGPNPYIIGEQTGELLLSPNQIRALESCGMTLFGSPIYQDPFLLPGMVYFSPTSTSQNPTEVIKHA